MGATTLTQTRRGRSRGSIRVRRSPGRPTTAPLGAGAARSVHYFGSASTDDGTRLPHYAWQTSATTKPQSNQPYMAYWGTCTPCTLTAGAVPRRTTFTEAGGYAPVGKSVGVVTVRNLRTGQSGHTAALGSGIRRGALTPQVTVEVGDSYQITHTGTVYKQEADAYLVQILALGSGSGAFPFTTTGHGADRAELFALPHPYYLSASAPPPPPPPPADTTPPETTITSGPTGTTTAITASLGFSASESGSSFQCRLDSGSFGACTSAQSYSGLALGAHTFEVKATDGAGNADLTPASRSWTVEASPPPPPPRPPTGDETLVPATADKAAGRTASASSSYPGFDPAKALDGSSATRWSSSFSDNQWWRTDLGSVRQVDKVSINWEAAYASRYKILTSTDGTSYSLAAEVTISKAGWKTTPFSVRQARYVKVEGVTRSTIYGISFWDLRWAVPPTRPPRRPRDVRRRPRATTAPPTPRRRPWMARPARAGAPTSPTTSGGR